MTDLAIRVEGLSKRYQVGERKERYKTLRDIVANNLKSLSGIRQRNKGSDLMGVEGYIG